MNRRGLGVGMAVASCVLVFATAWAFAQPGQANVQEMRRLAVFVASSYEKVVSGTGACKTADANAMSRKVWAAALGCGAQNMSLVAGLKLKPLTSGSPLQNARVVATFEVTQVAGTVVLEVGARSTQNWYGLKSQSISQPGRYTVVGESFTLEADKPLEARGEVVVLNSCSELCGVSMRIAEIKWDF